jgi:preprotein translocase subunit SecG
MLYTFLLTLLVLDCIVVMVAVLLQAGKGTGLAANFGGASSSPDAFIGVRQAGNLLTKASWWGGGIFLFLCFILQMMSTHTSAPRSVLEKGLATPQQQAAPPTSSPAVPLEPAPSTNAPAATPNTKSPTTPTPNR